MISDRRLKVLCLHGHPGNSKAMQIFVQHFQEQGITAIAPDLRGYGNCKAIAPFAMLDHIQDLENLLEADILEHRHRSLNGSSDDRSEPEYLPECLPEYLILGWSLGGILAIELALRMIELQNSSGDKPKQAIPKIVGLVLIATAARPYSSLPKVAWWEYMNLAIAVALHWIVPRYHRCVTWFGKRSLIKYLIQQHSPFAYARISRDGARAYLQTSGYAQRALMQALRQGYDRTGDLAKIHIPCLAIAAEQDRHITAASTAETAKLLPHCEFICYPNTAHLLPWEISARLMADIDAWCDRQL